MSTITPTPMMQQWHACKKQAKDALLFFRLGDFYEAFYEDAILISKEIGVTLTKRQETPMCGVPFHSSESYIDQLLEKGFKVAIAEQVEDAKQTKTLVKREVVRIITPGSITHSSLLKDKSNNFFVSLVQIGSVYGLALIDLSTSDFTVLELESKQALLDELCKQKPAEFLVSQKFIQDHASLFAEIEQVFTFVLTEKEAWHFDPQSALHALQHHFQIQSLDGYGLRGMTAAIAAAGALLTHLQDALHLDIAHLKTIQKDSLDGFLSIDRTTMRHLELLEPLHDAKGKNTLFDLLDFTLTPMGGRLLANWIKRPLFSLSDIEQRQLAIEELIVNPDVQFGLRKALERIKDLERLIMRISNSSAGPRDLISLSLSLASAMQAKEELKILRSPLMKNLFTQLHNMSDLIGSIEKAIHENPPLRASDTGIFKEGYNEELDEYHSIRTNSKDWLTRYQQDLRESTQIKTLKVGYTRVFGYYIEVSKAQAKNMPEDFQRRQTLVNGERFISTALKEFEYKILGAEDKIKALESKLYEAFLKMVSESCQKVQEIARALAQIDSLSALAFAARQYNYVKPTLDESDRIEIRQGRHPIIDQALAVSAFIPNDTFLDSKTNQLLLITGPNMAGKSTYIRQVALIVILAQIGSFVPAESAHIGLVDQVFTRIGASDDLARGQSTFMVEMTETANILRHATSRSLVILDEIGRGTSTYDGIAIAWSVAEYLLTEKNRQAKTLFATHYWELTQLEKEYTQAKNFQVAVKETPEGIVFLHQIIRGDTDRSYGIHVARLAGLPFEALQSAQRRLSSLEKNHRVQKKVKPRDQFNLFEDLPKENPLLKELKDLNLNTLSPMQAQQKLFELQQRAHHDL